MACHCLGMYDWTYCPTSGTAAIVVMSNQQMELSHSQSYDHASTSRGAQTNCEYFVDDDDLTNAWKNLESLEWKAPQRLNDQATINMYIYSPGSC